MATYSLAADVAAWIARMAEPFDARVRRRLQPIFIGALFAQGRRTVASWLRAAGIRRDWADHYYFLGSVGRKIRLLGMVLLGIVMRHLVPGERLLLALDDSPTKRYGPKVEGAGIHHNPTPGPAEQEFLYGHVWVTLALVTSHALWGTIALPLLAELYIRQKDVPRLPAAYGWKFCTKLELAAGLVAWAADVLKHWNKRLWIVVDGAYAKRPFVRRALAAGVTVVSRLRKDAALFSVPQPLRPGQRRRGRPRKYGTQRFNLAKRAGQKGGWQMIELVLYGKPVTKIYKTFVATYPPVGGPIRVVLVKEDSGWVAFFCTDVNASVAEILSAVADRSAIEQVFHDVKEVHGAGQQQVRHVWASVAAWNLTLWLYTLVELWAWNRPHAELVDRRASPWDNPARRPSHADRARALRRASLRAQFSRLTARRLMPEKLRRFLARLTATAA
jgi:hypothetical protein